MDGGDGWSGDLRQLVTWCWPDSSTSIVAVATVQDGGARVWMNSYHLRDCDLRLVWYWARHAAGFRAPLDVLYAEDLAALHRDHVGAHHEV